ncbi:guanine nucleotide-exchange factor SEC12 [Chironomus tepperi]|uniref:guanine nucleotide-exchange factor SEC12 n=1 Tax=Chironomus tepperi TaxID=113505 RepID=UPI00391EEAAC
MGSKKNMVTDCLLAKVNFPLYAAEMLTSRHLLVAGGGGSAKTGVANGFEIYELYHNGKFFVAEEIQRHETGSRAVMNMSMKIMDKKTVLVAGQESHSQMFIVTPKVGQIPPKENATTTNRRESSAEVRQRRRTESTSQDTPKTSSTSTDSSGKQMKRVYFEIKPGDSIQTDFFEREPLQRVVRISMNGKFMATGGLDGHVRVWNFPRMTPLHDIQAHQKELDDIDFSPDSKHVISIAKDGVAAVWSVSNGREVMKLQWTPPENVKYLYKRCRYATIEGNPDKYRLFTISNPLQKAGKQRGFLQQWNIETGRLNNIVPIDESLSALSVRDDGRFLAVGTMFTGSVMIYIAFSLQQVLYVPNAHSMFVTGLEFIPVLNKDAPPISSDTEASVVSYSVDNRICIHSLQYRHTLPAWAAIILIVVILFLTFLLCSYFQI